MLAKRTLRFADEASIEAAQPIDPPEQKVAFVAITDNPFAGRFDRGLKLVTDASFEIEQKVSKTAVAMSAPYQPDAGGKTAPIIMNGKQERGVAILTIVFGSVSRDADSKAWISSITKYVAPGATIDIPLTQKDAHNVRCHYDGIKIALPRQRLPNEIATMCSLEIDRGRPNDRVGELAACELKASTA